MLRLDFIIIGKQTYPLLGLRGNRFRAWYEAYQLLPEHLGSIAWPVAIIGLLSLGLLFLYPLLKKAVCDLQNDSSPNGRALFSNSAVHVHAETI